MHLLEIDSMYKKYLVSLLWLHWTLAGAQDSGGASALTEQDFLSEMPIVLSVSRLAQRLDETPGAVTILDRNFIRMSGARDVVDLLRVVPGFQTTTTFETEAPMASYHGRNDDWANRIQVLVDGRSVYSSHLQGSAGLGLQTLAMDDIERIEILRGSNSAAYGARAFLGVVNIISRDVRETGGAMGSVTAGENRVADVSTRVGWGDLATMYRISADTRSDAGLRGAYGENRISRVNFSAHIARDGGMEIDLRGGGVNIDAGHGSLEAAQYGNPPRMRFLGSQFLQVDWRKALGQDEDIAVSASHTENTFRDKFPYLNPDPGMASFYGIDVDFGGQEFNDALTLQHTTRHSAALRTVWGAELRREKVVSPSSFDARSEVSTDFYRVFGNLEWRLVPTLILNAGAMLEQSDMVGDSVAPRVMLNWHVAEGHTLRAGVSTAFRPPSAYEKYALVRYYPAAGAPPAAPITTVQSSGLVTSERIDAQELGYQWRLPHWRLEGDLRVFNEHISDGIDMTETSIIDYRNTDNYRISGAEMQLNWKPWTTTQIFLTQSWTDTSGAPVPLSVDDSHPYRVTHASARYASSLMLMHTLPSGWDVSLIYSRFDDMALMSGEKDQTYSGGRADLRIAKAFKLGKSKGGIALTVQNLDAPYQDGNRKFHFDKRAMLTLRFEN
jgi:iron complex outermembrane receptor protein